MKRTSKALDYLSKAEHAVIPISGSGKTGKSAALFSIAELAWPDRKKAILDVKGALPVFPGYEMVHRLGDVPCDCVCVLEDVNRLYPSRGSAGNAELQRWLGIISHKNIVVMLTSQNLADTDLAFFRTQDLVHVMKKMHIEDIPYERTEYRTVRHMANRLIDTAHEVYGGDYRAYSYFPRWNEIVALPLPKWWGKEHSHYLREVRV